ncbi:hypothetical protein D3C85_1711480 [compost metagenome]
MAAAQAQGFAGELEGILASTWLQHQQALQIQPGAAQPGIGQSGRRCDEGQPARVLVLAQLA